MELTVLQRVNYLIDNSDKTKNFVANEIGMSTTTVWRQLKGEQALSAKLIEGILQAFPDVSAEWLMRGKGEMYSSKPYEVHEDEPMMVAEPMAHDEIVVPDSVWKARYETMKECYDSLLSSLGGVMGKRNVG